MRGIANLQQKLYLTLGEAAATLGVHPNTLRNWDRLGRVRLSRLPGSRHRRVPVSEMERLLAQMQAEPPVGAGVHLEPPHSDPARRAEGEKLAATIKQELASVEAGTLEECMRELRGRSWS